MRSIAVIGAGYWGPNLVRNFRGQPGLGPGRGVRPGRGPGPQGRRRPLHRRGRDLRRAAAGPAPTSTRWPSPPRPGPTRRSRWPRFEAGKHVLVEKPLADNAETAALMVAAAEAAGRVLMIDHTYCYTPAVQYIRDVVASGELGEILYVDSIRINLGLVQPDVDVFWDLAPHDLSILDFILPGGLRPGLGQRDRRRPARRRQGLRRLPDHAAGQRRHRPRQRQLALAHQDPADGHRRQPPHPGLGRPEPAAAGLHPRPRRRPRAPRPPTPRSARRSPSPTGWVTSPSRRCRRRRRCRRWRPSSPPPSTRAARRGPTARAGLRVLSVLEAVSAEPGALGGAEPHRAGQRHRAPSRSWSHEQRCDLSGRHRPGHRRRRHHRLDHRRPAAGGRRRPRCGSWTTWSAAGAATCATALDDPRLQLVVGDIRDVDLVHDLTTGCDLVFHQAAIRITQCAEEPRLALEVLVDGTFNVIEAAAAARGRQARRRLVGVGLRPGRGVPDHRAAPPLRQRHLLRRGQDVQRGHAAQLPGDVRPGLRRRCATSTSTARGWTSTACTPRC